MIYYDDLSTDMGTIYVALQERGVCKVALREDDWQTYLQRHSSIHDRQRCAGVRQELQEYFRGERRQFTVPLVIEGTYFYRQVWQALLQIPYGQVRTYEDIAREIGRPRAYRAVGQANYHNPLPILIPCHRVIGKNGKLTGYMGSYTGMKAQLLQLEGAMLS
ncbi:methylated-DNA--[protein]-cysteine S-methyltransferase [Heliophilum fasciatum]|nr:methylated-DNA--[protein]-cysteine S-methyltransferase [Heliophilum fasciatum]MCW2277563.1 methylated-DNA-[protein]-cysteine S-methyltransferase [Heliophilum fasciatum]